MAGRFRTLIATIAVAKMIPIAVGMLMVETASVPITRTASVAIA